MDTARTHARTKRNDLPVRAFPPTCDIYIYIYIYIGGWGEGPYREIVSFRSCVRTRGVHCLVGTSPNRDLHLFPFPFVPERLSLLPSKQCEILPHLLNPPIQLWPALSVYLYRKTDLDQTNSQQIVKKNVGRAQ